MGVWESSSTNSSNSGLQARRDVATAPVVVLVRDFLAGQAHEVLLRVDVRAGGVHLDVGKEAAVDGVLVGYGIATEVDCGIVVKDFGLNADL